MTLLTADHGLVRAFVRGGKQLKNRRAAATSLFCYGEFALYRGRDAYTVDSAAPLRCFLACGRILIGWQLPNILPSLATNWRRRNNRRRNCLRLLLNTLHLLCKGTKPLVQIKAVFELRALSISGYMPNILACANCGTYETPVMYFDVDGGCIYCENCPKAGAVAVPKTVMTAVRYICLTEPGRIFGFALSPEQMALLGRVTEQYTLRRLDRRSTHWNSTSPCKPGTRLHSIIMDRDMDKNLQTLELDKVLALLAEQTTCDDAKEAALALRPAADPGEIALLLDQTEDAFSMLARFGAPSFGGLHNVNGPLQRAAAGGCLNMTELLQVGDTLRALRILDDWHGHLAGTSSSLNFFFDGITVNKYLENRIFTCIVSPEEMADKASEELYDIRRKIKAKAAAIRQRLDGMIHSTHYQKFLQEPIVTQRGGRFVVPVKAEHRGEVPGLVHDTSSSGATVFIEPAAVVDANNDIKVLEGREREEVQRILFELSAEAGTFAESVRHSYDSAVRLNLIFAKAHLAYQMKAARPQLNTEGVTDLKNARHPLIDKERVVPVHITLGADYDTLVITAPIPAARR